MIRLKISSIIFLLYITWCSAQFRDEFQEFNEEACIGEDKFPCIDGGCVLQSQYCDGSVDCDDGSDEDFCLTHKLDAVSCNTTHQYMCLDKKRCIPNTFICNNRTECEDGSDEANCTTTPKFQNNSTCNGFACSEDLCISLLWLCDGRYDCPDHSDENNEELCRIAAPSFIALDTNKECFDNVNFFGWTYGCLDASYCVPEKMMCNGIRDCRDGSDEGEFCARWQTMCNTDVCPKNLTFCVPDRNGPRCFCHGTDTATNYNFVTNQCDDVNECLKPQPQCSQMCTNGRAHFLCQCEDGYTLNEYGYVCTANGPEGKLFFSTRNDIRYVTVKSKEMVTVASGLKEAHGVASDGTYVYWVETAQGHQSIFKAQLDDVETTKQVLVSLGVEDPGDIAVDFLGGNLYFSDAARGVISTCRADGAFCTTIRTDSHRPRFVTLDPKNGKMYWADWKGHGVIMSARMDGSEPEVLVDHLEGFATGLATDAPNDRLYYVDRKIKVITVHEKQIYTLFEEKYQYPYSVAVFESLVYWSDWTTNSLQITEKIHGKRSMLVNLDIPILGMHIYHPVLMNTTVNPCRDNNCSHLCIVTSNTTHVCACPDFMEMADNQCQYPSSYRAKYLIVGGGQLFTRIQYDSLGNPDTHATHFDIGRVQAMAYDYYRDSLYVFDSERRTISYISMNDFTLGVTHTLLYNNLQIVIDMDYDYATDNLYILDAGRRVIEALSLKNQKRGFVYKFVGDEQPISFCVMPEYGRMVVAVVENDMEDIIHIDSIGLDGQDRKHLILNNLRGPHVRLRYVPHMHSVFVSDESNGIIDSFHPEGTGRENYRDMLTTVTTLAVADHYVFWTDRKTSRLFWSDIHETGHHIRRMDLTLFPNNTQLLIQGTYPIPDPKDPILNHPCLKNVCSDICVQQPHSPENKLSQYPYKCLCPPGMLGKDGGCSKMVECHEKQILCHRSNKCVMENARCDGVKDCDEGEDEEECPDDPNKTVCTLDKVYCNGICVEKNKPSACNPQETPVNTTCQSTEYACLKSTICISRTQLCDTYSDCPYGDDEGSARCDMPYCLDTEFMCTSGSCIPKTFKCDGQPDCDDNYDETDCENTNCPSGFYQCKDEKCIEIQRRCDGKQDCSDNSDEEECEEPQIEELFGDHTPRCRPWEFSCEHNSSICLPPTARCNVKVDCPGGTDEHNCEPHCFGRNMFECVQQPNCIQKSKMCDGHKDCDDGSDEAPDACARANRTSGFYVNKVKECNEGFLCKKEGGCLEWAEVCDGKRHCVDGSDEGGICSTACENNKCASNCQPTPTGPQCTCDLGFRLESDQRSCQDIDECPSEVCAQRCDNVPGSFFCGCYHGFVMRSDRRSCKAVNGKMKMIYASGSVVRSVNADGYSSIMLFESARLTDVDYDVRAKMMYVTSADGEKLVQMDAMPLLVTVTNIGRPTKVAVDWVTNNVYVVDSTPNDTKIIMCHFRHKKCANLQRLPSNSTVAALVVDPNVGRMFYCVNRGLDSVLWSASLCGSGARDIATLHNCSGLTIDHAKKWLYVAEREPSHFIRMDFEGENQTYIFLNNTMQFSPRELAIFEDHLYFLVSNKLSLNRCRLYGSGKRCESFVRQSFEADGIAIMHETLQNDLKDPCKNMACSYLCALSYDGPVCLCHNGTVVGQEKVCPEEKNEHLAMFNGWTHQELETHSFNFLVWTLSIVGVLMTALILYLYYACVYKLRGERPAGIYSGVTYRVGPDGQTFQTDPRLDFSPSTSGSTESDYLNPAHYVRTMWRDSFRKRVKPSMNPIPPSARPGPTADLEEDPEPGPSTPALQRQDSTDNESDIDNDESDEIVPHKQKF